MHATRKLQTRPAPPITTQLVPSVEPGINEKENFIQPPFYFRRIISAEKHGSWVAQYTLVRRELSGTETDPPSHQYQFNAIFRTENEADKYAARKRKSESMRTDRLMTTRSAMFCGKGKDQGVWKQSFHPKSVFPTCVEHLRRNSCKSSSLKMAYYLRISAVMHDAVSIAKRSI